MNGERIPPNKPTHCCDGTRIGIGARTFTLRCSGAPSASSGAAPTAPTGPSKVRASHLLVKHKDVRRPSSWKEDKVTRTQEEALAMVQAFRARIAAGEVEFGALAAVESHCSSARKDGDLGWFERGQMQKSFEDAAFALAVGELSEPVSGDSGVHIILRTG